MDGLLYVLLDERRFSLFSRKTENVYRGMRRLLFVSITQYDPRLKSVLIKLYSLDRVSAVSLKRQYSFRL